MKKIMLFAFVAAFAHQAEGFAYRGRIVPGIWQQSWNDTLKKSLAESELTDHKEAQIEKLCPGYNASTTKRNIFWQQLLVGLSWKESFHGPGNYVYFQGGINIGLYQIDPRLKSAYECEGNLYDALTNIRCGVKMAAHLVDKFGTFLSGSQGGMAAYWQPMRSTSPLNKDSRKFILDHVTQACKTGKIAYISTLKHLVTADNLDPSETIPMVNTIDDLGLDPSVLDAHPEELINGPPDLENSQSAPSGLLRGLDYQREPGTFLSPDSVIDI